MLKKIFGILFFLATALLWIGTFANGSMGGAQIFANVLASAFYIGSGVFLLLFDLPLKKSYLDGFQARERQATLLVVLIVICSLFGVLTAVGSATGYSIFELVVTALIGALPFFIPMLVLSGFVGKYCVPFWMAQIKFGLGKPQIQTILVGEEFRNCTDDGSVQVSTKYLLFPDIFVLIPLDQIASVKFYNFIEQDIIFKLTSGSKFEVVANKKQFEAVQTIVNK